MCSCSFFDVPSLSPLPVLAHMVPVWRVARTNALLIHPIILMICFSYVICSSYFFFFCYSNIIFNFYIQSQFSLLDAWCSSFCYCLETKLKAYLCVRAYMNISHNNQIAMAVKPIEVKRTNRSMTMILRNNTVYGVGKRWKSPVCHIYWIISQVPMLISGWSDWVHK